MTEIQGLTYYEALASGLPLLVKYDDNLEDVIQDGKNGFSFQNDDDFVPLAKKILNQKELYLMLKQNAYPSVERYSAQNYAKQMEAIYFKLLNDKKKMK